MPAQRYFSLIAKTATGELIELAELDTLERIVRLRYGNCWAEEELHDLQVIERDPKVRKEVAQ